MAKEPKEKNPVLGVAPCPLCKSDKAKVSLSGKSQLAYQTCSACGMQLFTRQGRSDELLRARMLPPAEASIVKNDDAGQEPEAVTDLDEQEPAESPEPPARRGFWDGVL